MRDYNIHIELIVMIVAIHCTAWRVLILIACMYCFWWSEEHCAQRPPVTRWKHLGGSLAMYLIVELMIQISKSNILTQVSKHGAHRKSAFQTHAETHAGASRGKPYQFSSVVRKPEVPEARKKTINVTN